MASQGPQFRRAGMANGTYGHIRISTDESVRAACRWDSGCADGLYGLLAGSVVMRRYYCIGSLDSGRQTGDGIVRATLQEGRECANGTYGHIRISADESMRATCRWDTGCANGSHGSMVGSAIMRQYYRMSSLDPGSITTDGIVRAAFWEGRGCANGSYGHTGISADKSMRAACRWDTGCANTSHGSMVGSASMRQYYCMSTLDLGRQTTNGIARAVIRVDRGCANGLYRHTGISADKSMRAACQWDSGCANGSHGSMVGSTIM